METGTRRIVLFTLVFLIGLFTLLSRLQDARPYWEPASVWDRLYYPLEINESRRFFATDVNLTSVFAAKDGGTVWAGGARGLIIKSTDSGATWRVISPGDSTFFRSPRFARTMVVSLRFHDDRRGWAILMYNPSATLNHAKVSSALLRTVDGGKTWKSPRRMPPGAYGSLHFVNRRLGWAVGWRGGLVHTMDGGKTWKTQKFPGGPARLNHVYFRNAKSGIVTGVGLVLRTDDGGKTWTRSNPTFASLLHGRVFEQGIMIAGGNDGRVYRSLNNGKEWAGITRKVPVVPGKAAPRRPMLSSFSFENEKRGCASSLGGAVFRTMDGGRTWEKARWGTAGGPISSIPIAITCRGSFGWVVGSRGAIHHTRNAGRTWLPQSAPNFGRISFNAQGRAFAVGDVGFLHRSDYGSRNWRKFGPNFPNAVPIQEYLPLIIQRDVFFANDSLGWAVGRGIQRTVNSGHNWKLLSSRRELNAVYFADRFRGWVTGDRGVLLRSADGGNTWERRATGTKADLHSVFFRRNAVQGWAAGRNVILRSNNGGANWSRARGVDGNVRSVHFADGKHGWAAGDGGLLLHSRDGGRSWRRRNVGVGANITTVYFKDANRGSLYSGSQLLRRTTDGGRTWIQPGWYILPGVWYYFVIGVLGLLLIFVNRIRGPTKSPSIANRPVSDRPLVGREEDRLNFAPLAMGLSSFVRNESTVPPLTIAITGEWGSGKSSLMNLIREDLSAHRFDPVFFNAWHHQQEEHLLAALLENIRMQAVPDWWRPRNWIFRARLFWIRTRDSWPFLALISVVYAFAMGLFHENLTDFAQLQNLVSSLFSPDQWKLNLLADASPAFGFIAGNISLVFYLLSKARAFGEQPANLLIDLKGRFSIRDIKAKTGFRYRFSREFADVTRALGVRKLVLFIDDLDRCRPENIIGVLEAVNFLATAGECVIFMGLALDRVKRCVSMAFRDLAADNETPESSNAFADEYLKKLFNIEVAVPRATSEQIENLLEPEAAIRAQMDVPVDTTADVRKTSYRKRLLEWTRDALAPLVPYSTFLPAIVLTIFSAAALYQLGRILGPSSPTKLTTAKIGSGGRITGAGRGSTEKGGVGRTRVADAGKAPARETSARKSNPYVSAYPSAITPAAMVVSVLLMILFLLRYVGQSRRNADIVRDDKDFVEAWRLWRHVVYAADAKPRSVKRFLNRVRLFAMRQRRYHAAYLTFLDRVYESVGLKLPPNISRPSSEDGGIIPEDLLVALCAIQYYNPACLKEGADDLIRVFGVEGFRLKEEDMLNKAIREHIKLFERKFLPAAYIKRLEYYQHGIQIN